jgi:vacuolar-type H+-ATPase subunit D/Vma8
LVVSLYNTLTLKQKELTMNVRDLIECLEGMDPEAEVHFQYNYGDHWRTQVAPTVDSVEMGVVTYSEYHRMPKVVEADWDDEDEESAGDAVGKPVVLLG